MNQLNLQLVILIHLLPTNNINLYQGTKPPTPSYSAEKKPISRGRFLCYQDDSASANSIQGTSRTTSNDSLHAPPRVNVIKHTSDEDLNSSFRSLHTSDDPLPPPTSFTIPHNSTHSTTSNPPTHKAQTLNKAPSFNSTSSNSHHIPSIPKAVDEWRTSGGGIVTRKSNEVHLESPNKNLSVATLHSSEW